MALLDGPLDEDLDFLVSLEEAVLESAGLLSTHPEDPWQTLATCGEQHNSNSYLTMPSLHQGKYLQYKGDIVAMQNSMIIYDF